MTSALYYYLNLESITVGSITMQVPESAFALNADGIGGMFIDSGTSITLLRRMFSETFATSSPPS
jgi:hypothetical protein